VLSSSNTLALDDRQEVRENVEEGRKGSTTEKKARREWHVGGKMTEGTLTLVVKETQPATPKRERTKRSIACNYCRLKKVKCEFALHMIRLHTEILPGALARSVAEIDQATASNQYAQTAS